MQLMQEDWTHFPFQIMCFAALVSVSGWRALSNRLQWPKWGGCIYMWHIQRNCIETKVPTNMWYMRWVESALRCERRWGLGLGILFLLLLLFYESAYQPEPEPPRVWRHKKNSREWLMESDLGAKTGAIVFHWMVKCVIEPADVLIWVEI